MGSGGRRNATEGAAYSANEAAKHVGLHWWKRGLPQCELPASPAGPAGPTKRGQFIAM